MAPEEQNYPDPSAPTRDLGPDPMAQGTPEDPDSPEGEREAEEDALEDEERGRR